MDKSNTIKLVAGGMVVAVAGLAGGAMLFPVEHTVTKEVIKEVIVEVPVVSTEVVTETIVKEVKVDNGKLADVLEAIYQSDGDLEFVTDDLKESEIAEIADRLVFEMDVQALAVAAVRAEAIDVLHKESVNGTVLDEDDMERLRIQDDRGEVEVIDRDFEDGDAEVKVTAFFEQDDVKYAADFLVLVKEGKVDEVEVDSIYLR